MFQESPSKNKFSRVTNTQYIMQTTTECYTIYIEFIHGKNHYAVQLTSLDIRKYSILYLL